MTRSPRRKHLLNIVCLRPSLAQPPPELKVTNLPPCSTCTALMGSKTHLHQGGPPSMPPGRRAESRIGSLGLSGRRASGPVTTRRRLRRVQSLAGFSLQGRPPDREVVVEQGGLGHVAEVLLDLNGRQVELIQVQDGDPPSRPSLTALAVRRDDTRWSKSSRLKSSLSSSPSLMIPLRTPASMPRHAPRGPPQCNCVRAPAVESALTCRQRQPGAMPSEESVHTHAKQACTSMHKHTQPHHCSGHYQ